ncbi:MAG: endonuclease [Bacilli bacterium]|nr:endonuclease [Bacilli bacterium]
MKKRVSISFAFATIFALASCQGVVLNSKSVSSSVSSAVTVSSSSSSEPASIPAVTYPDYYDGYYKELTSWENGDDLKDKLYNIIRNGYHAIPYNSPNWESNQYADQALDDFESVDIVYSRENNLKTQTSKNGVGWQREHAWCASLMTGETTGNAVTTLGRATDFHNLFASNYSGNTSRGNKNYGLANRNDSTFQDRTTDAGNDGYCFDSKNFEPGNKDKGRLARAIFYMGTMYKNDEGNLKGLSIVEPYVPYEAGSACKFSIGNLSTLLDWNSNPVDRLEYQHNQSVYTHQFEGVAQGNRNPYVDYPQLVDYVYGSKKNQSGSLSRLVPSAHYLKISDKTHSNYAISSAKREYLAGETFTSSDYSVVDVNCDYSYVEAKYEDTTLPYTFTKEDALRKGKTLSVVTPDGAIPYIVSVGDGSISSCNYQYTFENKNMFGETGSKIEASGSSVKLGDLSWTFSYDNPDNHTSISVSNNELGIKIGTATNNGWANTLFITCNDDLEAVKGVYIKANTASGVTYSMQISCGTYSTSGIIIKRESSSQVYGKSFEPVSGKLVLKITGVTNAIYLQQIGVSYGQ